jgi:putative ABC transport system permease protein
MIKQLINTLRSFGNKPILLFVSIPGLALGLTAFLLLISYVKSETSYDKHFETKDRVVRLYSTIVNENTVNNYPICLRKAYTEVPLQVPEIECATQLYYGGKFRITTEEKQLSSEEGIYSDPEFFKLFGLKLITGDINSALKNPLSVVLSETLAIKLFNTVDCLGKVIVTEDQNYSITGVIKDMPVNTHFKFDFLISISTIRPERFGGLEFFTYFLLKDGADVESAGDKISKAYDNILDDGYNIAGQTSTSGTELLPKLHIHSKADFDLSEKANITNLYMLSFLAAFILLIAVVNTINLFILYGEKRSMEIGIRKSLGAGLLNLRKLFYFETAVLCLAAFILAVIGTIAIIPLFAQVTNIPLSASNLFDLEGVVGVIIFLVFLIFICGAYPAMYLSKLSTIGAIKGGPEAINRKKWLSIVSVVIQFSISVFLIVCLLVIVSQVSYLKNIPLGFNPDKVIGISRFDNSIRKKSKSIKDELVKLPFVEGICSSSHHMGGGYSGQVIYPYGESVDNEKNINEYRIQHGFCEVMNLQLISGRSFSGAKEDRESVILNEAAIKMLGLEDPVGKYVVLNEDKVKIIGVTEDFYYSDNAGEEIQPLVLSGYSNWSGIFYLKLKSEFGIDERKQISDILTGFDEDYIPYIFELQDNYNRKFWREDQLIELLLYGTFLAIFLCFTGMFSLSVFNVEKRTKEIGIRKVMGSSSGEILIFLLSSMLKWVMWSMIPAFLIAYILLDEWLTGFANRITLGIEYFLIAGLLALVIAFVAVSIQSYIAATRNPVDSLRYE